jgi:hypothetical protein
MVIDAAQLSPHICLYYILILTSSGKGWMNGFVVDFSVRSCFSVGSTSIYAVVFGAHTPV